MTQTSISVVPKLCSIVSLVYSPSCVPLCPQVVFQRGAPSDGGERVRLGKNEEAETL